jgi:hypothetical protein
MGGVWYADPRERPGLADTMDEETYSTLSEASYLGNEVQVETTSSA